ncbi:hypothetical protein SAMN05421788_106225 [Filimonas lacunae]|uniref:Uncharacterized protein n=1 Tax=Filimonas lacunae TaxID=477680 RepID=A0A1N7QQE0_9BACT|nr:hypothetical protein SAMN05421788_106225 [Filimonas lacunae]
MLVRFLKILLAVLSAMCWVVLIYWPQEAGRIMFAFWTALYFFPFFFIVLALITVVLRIGCLVLVRSFFHHSIAMLVNVMLLVAVAIFSWRMPVPVEEITLFAFCVNALSFTFSIFTYYRLQT